MEKAGGQYIMSRFIICRQLFVKYFRGDQNGVDTGGTSQKRQTTDGNEPNGTTNHG